MNRQTNTFEFGRYRLEPEECLLTLDGQAIPLEPQVFKTLRMLVENSGHLCEKNWLLKQVWGDTFVEEGNLVRNISVLRKVLGEGADGYRYIETVPKRGYRFVANVKKLAISEETALLIEEHTRSDVVIEEEINGREESGRLSFMRPNYAVRPVNDPSSPANYHTLGREALWHHRRQFIAVGAIVTLLVTTFVVSRWLDINRLTKSGNATGEVQSAAPLQKMKVTRLTTVGKVRDAAITPDGKYVAYVVADRGLQSLWLRQIADANSSVEIVPPAEVVFNGVSFSSDGDYIYYVSFKESSLTGVLYRSPVLGGTSRMLVVDVDSRAAISPDGKRLAFVRHASSLSKSAIITANVDGTGEQQVATSEFGRFVDPAWSPDGQSIACSTSRGSNSSVIVVEVQAAVPFEKSLTAQKWSSVSQIAWLADGSGLVVAASDQASAANQLWLLSYPGGEATRITNDVNDYQSVSLAAAIGDLVTIQSDRLFSIWLAQNGKAASAKQISSGKYDGDRGLAWTPDGRIVYASKESGNLDLWIMDADGHHRRQLTFNAGQNWSPSVCGDSRYIVFVSDRSGAIHLWRMSLDGSHPERLTDGNDDRRPNCSTDGKWVYYSSSSTKAWCLWKIPTEGGSPLQLTDSFSIAPTVSPDGRLVACLSADLQPTTELPAGSFRFVVIPSTGGQPRRIADMPPGLTPSPFRWSANARAVMYVNERDGVSNIWSQPLDGSAPKQVTDFASDRIFWFDWSGDGKQLVYARGVEMGDVVLISHFK